MIQKTTYKRAKSEFDMNNVVTRIKRRLRKKYGKRVTKSKIKEVWKDFVDIQIIETLAERGYVQIDKKFALEVVGQRIADNPRAMNLLTEGIIANKKAKIKLSETRRGYTYRIIMHEERFKEGKLIFEPHKRIETAVRHSLKNTNRYYRIIQNVS